MPMKSVIETLPAETLSACNAILQEPGMTIEKAIPRFQEIGVRVGKSAIGRHKKKIEDVAEDLRKSRIIADAVGRDLADTPHDKLAALTIELIQSQIFRTLTQASGEDDENPALDTKDLRALADAAYRLASAAKTDAERLFKVRKELAEQAVKAAVDTLKEREPGMSADTVDLIKRKILGLAQ